MRYRRQGYAREALSAVIDNAFGAGIHRVYAECDPRNTASWRLLEKVGLNREAHFRQNISSAGTKAALRYGRIPLFMR